MWPVHGPDPELDLGSMGCTFRNRRHRGLKLCSVVYKDILLYCCFGVVYLICVSFDFHNNRMKTIKTLIGK